MRTASRITSLGLVLVCAAAVLAATGKGDPPPPKTSGPQEVEVVGLFVHRETEQPTVVLQGKRDKRTFAMVIGAAEATGIALPLRHVTPPRPLTHDLFLTLFGRLNVTVKKVIITDLRDDIYYATVFLAGGNGEIQLDSRPSDAIALAIRARAPVYVEERVFEKSERLSPGPAPTSPRI
jgi:hypothetical protein